ncbi:MULTISPECIES: GTPase Era [unclassified Oceanobacter]|jgi:GTP-binding protein Era|uniref:GTPase Era n=1 Tax=unclassified Oceanobacter TaxID=2620260 RepID=UPI0026E2041E|nr:MULTISPECIES: GTPase Era [unclassified Oceanobacter]MDO6682583.1 GTPase Era [Oceanobacter sp. 5_MG-2023]MDP2506799.1 GTPase Era [Oceanobacter sp. 3_MG-2023]MDP2547892.1 GTPase Era [Oceanobacter sp. 4_MG-2023]MDP2608816.1 GTPase Era [Oceanobacter sp. 1_MG-2023]MDP2611942.1 GTPase Era [Oceanobacter sp. 2_MG-2023]
MTQRTGFVAIVGRPNVGKSTLLNRILGQKLSITSRKPQTTRHQILGIKTEEDVQVVYVDTPGIHLHQEKAINRYMNKAATTAVKDVDLVVMVVDRTRWTEEDDLVLQAVSQQRAPVVLVVNKVDFIKDKDEELLPYLQTLSERYAFAQIVPLSAKTGRNVDRLESLINSYLPEAGYFYPEDQITDRSSRFLAAELVREKIMRQLGDELPYAMTVEIEEFTHDGRLAEISALILVERSSQKRIVIGDAGSRIKQIGQDARKDMEILFDCKVMLNLWVKVKANWSDDERALRSLGYDDRV